MLIVIMLSAWPGVFTALGCRLSWRSTSAPGGATLGFPSLSRTFAGLIGLETFLTLTFVSCFSLLGLFELPLEVFDSLPFSDSFGIFPTRAHWHLCLFCFVLA